MKTLALSFVASFVTIIWGAISYLKGPLVIGCIVGAIILAFSPAHAAVIQCNASDCSMLAQSFPEWWSLIPLHTKAAFVLFFAGLTIGNVLMWHDKKVTTERIKKEEKEWLKKYHS